MRLQFTCTIEGVGVDPDDPPLVWEAFDGTNWHACEVGEDTTGGLNRDGSITVHVSRQHSAALLDGERRRLVAGTSGARRGGAALVQCVTDDPWSRGRHDRWHCGCRPRRRRRAGNTGGHRGVPGETFKTAYAPVLPAGEPLRLLITSDDGTTEWHQVEHFADSSPTDPHFMLDAVHGTIMFGPGVREPDGSLRQYGAVAPKGAIVQLEAYATGGGRIGNVGPARSARSSRRSRSSRRREPGHPRSEVSTREDLESADPRTHPAAHAHLRGHGRGLRAAHAAAAPEVARVKCLPARRRRRCRQRADPGGPGGADHRRQIRFEDLLPTEETMARSPNVSTMPG